MSPGGGGHAVLLCALYPMENFVVCLVHAQAAYLCPMLCPLMFVSVCVVVPGGLPCGAVFSTSVRFVPVSHVLMWWAATKLHQTQSCDLHIFVPLPVPFRSPSSSIQAQFVKISTVNPQMSLVPRTTNAAEPLTRIGIRISLPRQIWQAQSAILLYLFMGCMDESWMHGMLVSPARRRSRVRSTGV